MITAVYRVPVAPEYGPRGLAERAAAEARRLLGNARRAQHKAARLAAAGGKDAAAGRRRGRLGKPVEDDLHAPGVRHVAIPRKGKPGKARQAAGRRPASRRAVKWRTGSRNPARFSPPAFSGRSS